MKIQEVQTNSIIGNSLKRFFVAFEESKEKRDALNKQKFSGRTEFKIANDGNVQLVTHPSSYRPRKVRNFF